MSIWTARQIPDLSGKVAIVTGASSGLGRVTAQALSQHGAQVIMAGQNADNAAAAMAEIQTAQPAAKLAYLPLDLSDLASVHCFADAFKARHDQLDLLINNAGVLGLPYRKTRDGFETLFGVNHLGHFALTGLLLQRLRATPKARVVTVSSLAHRAGKLPLDDLNWEHRPYSKGGAYGQSKLANLMFALELDRRLHQAGICASSLAAHPGYAATNIFFGQSVKASVGRRLWNLIARVGSALVAQPAALGALPTLYAAAAADARGGEYFGPRGWFEFRGYPCKVKPSAQALDLELAARLWQASEQLTGVGYLS